MVWNQWLGQHTHLRVLAQYKCKHTTCVESVQGQLEVAQMRELIEGSHFFTCKHTHPDSWRMQCGSTLVQATLIAHSVYAHMRVH